jgi:hypothetical protein
MLAQRLLREEKEEEKWSKENFETQRNNEMRWREKKRVERVFIGEKSY